MSDDDSVRFDPIYLDVDTEAMSDDDSVRFDPIYLDVFVFFSVSRFEVVGQCD